MRRAETRAGWRAAALVVAWVLIVAPNRLAAEPSAAAVAGFNKYVAQVESRLAHQHISAESFVTPVDTAHMRRGDLNIEKLTPDSSVDLPGALLHHWRGTGFVHGATAADLERVMRDYGGYPRVYAPQVVAARVQAQNGNHIRALLRVRQEHVITVMLDTAYDIEFTHADASPGTPFGAHGTSNSHSTRIDEIASPGTKSEHALDSNHEHGFLWRQNTYWSWEERDGGLYMQIESISLTRSRPRRIGMGGGAVYREHSAPEPGVYAARDGQCLAALNQF